MANVKVKFKNKEFLLSCDDGQEEHLEELLFHINQKFNQLKDDLGNLGENKLLLITAVKIMDEYYPKLKICYQISLDIEMKDQRLLLQQKDRVTQTHCYRTLRFDYLQFFHQRQD